MFSEFGHLINVEVKRRKNGKSRCFGFATFLDSRDSVLSLVEKRFIPVFFFIYFTVLDTTIDPSNATPVRNYLKNPKFLGKKIFLLGKNVVVGVL